MEKDYTKYYAKIMFKAIILLFIALIIFAAYKITMFYIPFLIPFSRFMVGKAFIFNFYSLLYIYLIYFYLLL